MSQNQARRDVPRPPREATEHNDKGFGPRKESLHPATSIEGAPPNKAPRVEMPKKTIVRLTAAYGAVNQGEEAGYAPEEAARLIESGIAVYQGGPKPPDLAPHRSDPEEQAQHAIQIERLVECCRVVLQNPKTVDADGRPSHGAVQTMMGTPVNPADIDLAVGQLRGQRRR